MSLIDPTTSRPMHKLTDEQIYSAFMQTNAKLDTIGTQMTNQAFLLEFVIEKLNTYAEEHGIEPLAIKLDEFEAYYQERVVQLEAELKQAMAADLERTTKSRINLDG
jgi:hypothetical protein